MIALLRGRPAHRAADSVVFDVGGVGYLVSAPSALVARLPSDRDSTLHISMIVREDAMLLFGFETPETRDAFDIIRQVNGVGPRTALSLLSGMSPGELADAIGRGDTKTLCRAPGVGKKLAERLCLELDGKRGRGLGAGDRAGRSASAGPGAAGIQKERDRPGPWPRDGRPIR